jgi:hypothetical protein
MNFVKIMNIVNVPPLLAYEIFCNIIKFLIKKAGLATHIWLSLSPWLLCDIDVSFFVVSETETIVLRYQTSFFETQAKFIVSETETIALEEAIKDLPLDPRKLETSKLYLLLTRLFFTNIDYRTVVMNNLNFPLVDNANGKFIKSPFYTYGHLYKI